MWAIATIILTLSLGAVAFALLRVQKNATHYKMKFVELTTALKSCRNYRLKEGTAYDKRIRALENEISKLKNVIDSIDSGGV